MKNIDLREYGLKKTPGRESVLSILKTAKLPLNAETIFAKSRAQGLNLSTIYRALSSFEKAGIVKREINETGENSFILSKAKHNHVIICVNCHKKTYLNECPYEAANKRITKETGYEVFDHNVQLFGLCPDCQKKKNGSK
jgi:Fur family transcriptional regulator, ferric uptake regulator